MLSSNVIRPLFVVIAAAGIAAITTAQLLSVQTARFCATDNVQDGGYGYSLALDGHTLLVGQPYTDASHPSQGAAYVSIESTEGWVQQAKLTPSDPINGNLFGWSVALDGDTAVIGARQDDDWGVISGSAYVFVRTGTTWTQQAKLLASDGAIMRYFGESVAIEGDTIVVGAPNYSSPTNPHGGGAYVFTRSGTVWTQVQKLTGSQVTNGQEFGKALALDGNTLLVGVRYGGALGTGAVYEFIRSTGTWSEHQILIASDPTITGEFGDSLALEGDRAIIGAPYSDAGGLSSGAAYIFQRNAGTWAQQQRLIASDAGDANLFGYVALDADRAIVGAQQNGDGAAYVFEFNGVLWTETDELFPESSEPTHRMGAAVALRGPMVLAGAADAKYGFSRAGAVFEFLLNDAPIGTQYCTGDFGASCPCGNVGAAGAGRGCVNSTGTGALLSAVGSTSVAADDAIFFAEGMRPKRNAVFARGAQVSGPIYGDGLRCIGLGIERLGLHSANEIGAATWGPGMSSTHGWSAGQTLYLQVFYRDAATPCGTTLNTTNALSVTLTP